MWKLPLDFHLTSKTSIQLEQYLGRSYMGQNGTFGSRMEFERDFRKSNGSN